MLLAEQTSMTSLCDCQSRGLTRVLNDDALVSVEEALVDFVHEHLRIDRDGCATDRGTQQVIESRLAESMVAIDFTDGDWCYTPAMPFNDYAGEVGFEAKAFLECVVTEDGRHWAVFVIDDLNAPL